MQVTGNWSSSLSNWLNEQDGNFYAVSGVAVDEARGVLYIAEFQSWRVQKYELSTGAYLGVINSPRTPSEDMWVPTDIAVDADGNLLLTDGGNAYIYTLSPDGEVLRRWQNYGRGPGQWITPAMAPSTSPQTPPLSLSTQRPASSWPSGPAAACKTPTALLWTRQGLCTWQSAASTGSRSLQPVESMWRHSQ